ncbi:MAG: rhodanese-like domain-containing protein [Candidatus Kapaibacterium sp.]|nr:MAG: rhodanese-like domain-containing protein [Candidatus Kapabacteria bacterium]
MQKTFSGTMFVGIAVTAISVFVLLFLPPVTMKNAGLRVVELLIRSTLPRSEGSNSAVQEISVEELSEQLQQHPSQILLFDVREEKEYVVSHIQGAVRLSPEIKSEEFRRVLGRTAPEKKIVFYCSVGKRSGDAVCRLERAAKESGAEAVFNLTGGIFRWHNSSLPVVNEQGVVRSVHPFNRFWQMFVDG